MTSSPFVRWLILALVACLAIFLWTWKYASWPDAIRFAGLALVALLVAVFANWLAETRLTALIKRDSAVLGSQPQRWFWITALIVAHVGLQVAAVAIFVMAVDQVVLGYDSQQVHRVAESVATARFSSASPALVDWWAAGHGFGKEIYPQMGVTEGAVPTDLQWMIEPTKSKSQTAETETKFDPEQQSQMAELIETLVRLSEDNDQIWVRFDRDVWWNGQRPRNVFRMRDKLKAKIGEEKSGNQARKLAFRIAVVFATSKELEKVAGESLPKPAGTTQAAAKPMPAADTLTAEDRKSLELTPAHFDGLRAELLDRVPAGTVYVRAIYTGWPNLVILLTGVALAAFGYCRHLRLIAENQVQQPGESIDQQDFVSDSTEAGDMDFETFWKYRNLGILVGRVEQAAESGSKTLVVEQLKSALIKLKASRDQWENPNIPERAIVFAKVAREATREAVDDALSRLPSSSVAAQHWPEFLTELGFLGTIYGLLWAMAAAANTQVPSDDPLYRSAAVADMMLGLSVAFTTTLMGLLAAIALRDRLQRWTEAEEVSTRETAAEVLAHLEANMTSLFRLAAPRL